MGHTIPTARAANGARFPVAPLREALAGPQNKNKTILRKLKVKQLKSKVSTEYRAGNKHKVGKQIELLANSGDTSAVPSKLGSTSPHPVSPAQGNQDFSP